LKLPKNNAHGVPSFGNRAFPHKINVPAAARAGTPALKMGMTQKN